jgi:NAD(P)-dependent dehydrogenase (short-subunit alcohol dehydrogenase family)
MSEDRTARFRGRVAVVTGGTSGIGRGCCLRLAQEGAVVVVAGRNWDAGREVAIEAGNGAEFQALDVTSATSWQSLASAVVADAGPPHVLINAAGVSYRRALVDTSLEEWHHILQVNLDGVFLGCHTLLPLMREHGCAAIVNVGSASAFRSAATMAAYDASKGALSALTKSIARHCANSGSGVRCNAVHPGTVETPMLERSRRMDPESVAGWLHAQPLRHLGQTGDIAGTIAWLASDEAKAVSGADIVVDGGWLA